MFQTSVTTQPNVLKKKKRRRKLQIKRHGIFRHMHKLIHTYNSFVTRKIKLKRK